MFCRNPEATSGPRGRVRRFRILRIHPPRRKGDSIATYRIRSPCRQAGPATGMNGTCRTWQRVHPSETEASRQSWHRDRRDAGGPGRPGQPASRQATSTAKRCSPGGVARGSPGQLRSSSSPAFPDPKRLITPERGPHLASRPSRCRSAGSGAAPRASNSTPAAPMTPAIRWSASIATTGTGAISRTTWARGVARGCATHPGTCRPCGSECHRGTSPEPVRRSIRQCPDRRCRRRRSRCPFANTASPAPPAPASVQRTGRRGVRPPRGLPESSPGSFVTSPDLLRHWISGHPNGGRGTGSFRKTLKRGIPG